MDLQKLCDALSEFPLSFTPGRKWEYSMGIDVIGRVIEIVSGKNLSEFITETILEPAEMQNTGFFLKNDIITFTPFFIYYTLFILLILVT